MTEVVLLDAGPLGLVTNPRRSPQSAACAAWLQSLVTSGVRIVIPEIADYEVRRELLCANKTAGIARLDALTKGLEYLPITTPAMRQAAAFWATARQQRPADSGGQDHRWRHDLGCTGGHVRCYRFRDRHHQRGSSFAVCDGQALARHNHRRGILMASGGACVVFRYGGSLLDRNNGTYRTRTGREDSRARS